jgi:uncharacterized protein
MTKRTQKIIIILSVIVIMLLVFFMMGKPATSEKTVDLENGVQVIRMTESIRGYSPNSFTIKKGVPVRWEIEGSTDRTCANALIVPDYKIREFLKPGKNVVEFTPSQTGVIPFSCSMRMYTGSFNVIE